MPHQELSFADEIEKVDEWLKAHFEEIVDRYARRVIAVLDQEIVEVGESIHDGQRKVAEHHPVRVPLVFEVPSREEFTCLLSNTDTPSWRDAGLL
jgi:hypothetical protein